MSFSENPQHLKLTEDLLLQILRIITFNSGDPQISIETAKELFIKTLEVGEELLPTDSCLQNTPSEAHIKGEVPNDPNDFSF